MKTFFEKLLFSLAVTILVLELTAELIRAAKKVAESVNDFRSAVSK